MDIVINLIGVSNLENANCFQTYLHLVFGMLKYKSKKTCLQNYIEENRNYFSSIDMERVILLTGK